MSPKDGLSWHVRNSSQVTKQLTPTHREISVVVGQGPGVGLRLDRFLALALPTLSRSLIKSWLERRYGTVDDKPAKPSVKVSAGMRIFLKCPLPPNPVDRNFEAEQLDILYEQDAVLVVNKPPGQLAHQAGRVLHGTVLNQIQERLVDADEDPQLARLVNRIDRDTSGIIVCTLDTPTNRALSTALQNGRFHKEYLAICHGVPEPGSGHWRQAIRDDPTGMSIARQLHPSGQPSHTEYRVIAHVGTGAAGYALLRIVLHTGRQHQIRVHAAGNGHPLVGDWTYGPPCEELPGQALHAALLRFPHPQSGEPVTVEAPLHPVLGRLWHSLSAGAAVTPRELDSEERRRLGLLPGRDRRSRLEEGGWVRPTWLDPDEYRRLASELGETTSSDSSVSD